jgi:hypothetical protein
MSYLYDVVEPLTLNVAYFYEQYYTFIDPVLAFAIFLAIGNYVFTHKYQSKFAHDKPAREAKMIAVAVALALAFAFALLEANTGFYFGAPVMQGFAGIIFLIIFGVLLFEVLKTIMMAQCAVAFAYFIMYGVFMSAYSQFYLQIHGNYPIVAAVLGIGFIIAVIGVLICFFKMLGGMFSGGGGKDTDHPDEDHKDPHHAPEDPAHTKTGDDKKKGDEKPADPNKPPTPPPTPEEKNELVEDLNKLNAAKNSYITAINEFKEGLINLLQTRHAFQEGKASVDDMHAATDKAWQLGAKTAPLLQIIQQITEKIFKDTGFPKVTEEYTQHLGKTLQDIYHASIQHAELMKVFENTYNAQGFKHADRALDTKVHDFVKSRFVPMHRATDLAKRMQQYSKIVEEGFANLAKTNQTAAGTMRVYYKEMQEKANAIDWSLNLVDPEAAAPPPPPKPQKSILFVRAVHHDGTPVTSKFIITVKATPGQPDFAPLSKEVHSDRGIARFDDLPTNIHYLVDGESADLGHAIQADPQEDTHKPAPIVLNAPEVHAVLVFGIKHTEVPLHIEMHEPVKGNEHVQFQYGQLISIKAIIRGGEEPYHWALTAKDRSDRTVSSFESTSPVISLDVPIIPIGKYKFSLDVTDNKGEPVKKEFHLEVVESTTKQEYAVSIDDKHGVPDETVLQFGSRKEPFKFTKGVGKVHMPPGVHKVHDPTGKYIDSEIDLPLHSNSAIFHGQREITNFIIKLRDVATEKPVANIEVSFIETTGGGLRVLATTTSSKYGDIILQLPVGQSGIVQVNRTREYGYSDGKYHVTVEKNKVMLVHLIKLDMFGSAAALPQYISQWDNATKDADPIKASFEHMMNSIRVDFLQPLVKKSGGTAKLTIEATRQVIHAWYGFNEEKLNALWVTSKSGRQYTVMQFVERWMANNTKLKGDRAYEQLLIDYHSDSNLHFPYDTADYRNENEKLGITDEWILALYKAKAGGKKFLPSIATVMRLGSGPKADPQLPAGVNAHISVRPSGNAGPDGDKNYTYGAKAYMKSQHLGCEARFKYLVEYRMPPNARYVQVIKAYKVLKYRDLDDSKPITEQELAAIMLQHAAGNEKQLGSDIKQIEVLVQIGNDNENLPSVFDILQTPMIRVDFIGAIVDTKNGSTVQLDSNIGRMYIQDPRV